MPRLRKVYLPKWMTAFGLIVLIPMWLWVSYTALFTPEGRADLGVGGWIIMTIVFAAIGTVLALMGSRRLPAYLIEDDEDA